MEVKTISIVCGLVEMGVYGTIFKTWNKCFERHSTTYIHLNEKEYNPKSMLKAKVAALRVQDWSKKVKILVNK